jgi:hypothetical protein
MRCTEVEVAKLREQWAGRSGRRDERWSIAPYVASIGLNAA